MADHRSRRQKLEAMANQTASPHEAEVARRMLARMKPDPQPAQRQAAADPYYTRWAAEDFNTRWEDLNTSAPSANADLHFDAVWNSTTHRYDATYADASMSYNDILRRMQQAQDVYEAAVRDAKWAEYERRKTAEAPSSREEAEKPHWWDRWNEMHDPVAAEAAQRRRRWEEERSKRTDFFSTDEFKRWYQNEVVDSDPERG